MNDRDKPFDGKNLLEEIGPIGLLTHAGWVFPAEVYEQNNAEARAAGRTETPIPPEAYLTDTVIPGPTAQDVPITDDERAVLSGTWEDIEVEFHRRHPGAAKWPTPEGQLPANWYYRGFATFLRDDLPGDCDSA